MNPNSGSVGQTPAEATLANNAQASFQDYQTRFLPLQQHLNDITDAMNSPTSWQNQEAEGKAGADVVSQADAAARQTASQESDAGINVGSGRFKFAVTSGAAAEAEAKGGAIAGAHEQITTDYLANLKAISDTGEGIAGAATGGMAISGEVGSREAISGAQVENEQNAAVAGGIGYGVGAGIQGGINAYNAPPTQPTGVMNPAGMAEP